VAGEPEATGEATMTFLRRIAPVLALAAVGLVIAALLFVTGCTTPEDGQNSIIDPKAFGFTLVTW
jgi:hypothetical protein